MGTAYGLLNIYLAIIWEKDFSSEQAICQLILVPFLYFQSHHGIRNFIYQADGWLKVIIQKFGLFRVIIACLILSIIKPMRSCLEILSILGLPCPCLFFFFFLIFNPIVIFLSILAKLDFVFSSGPWCIFMYPL